MGKDLIWFHTAYPDDYKLLKEYAKENRNNMTLAERVLWEHLRGNAFGHRFLRQHIVGDYIVDFLCRDDGLVIEVDGAYHCEPRQAEADERRTAFLLENGFHVIRFTNEEILFDVETVLEAIRKELEEEGPTPGGPTPDGPTPDGPTPGPSLKGGE